MLSTAVDACLCVAAVYATSFLLTAVLPGTQVAGYALATPGGKPLQYCLNGFAVLLATAALAAATSAAGAVSPTVFADHYAASAATGCVIGLLLSAAYLVRGFSLVRDKVVDRRARCPTVDQSSDKTTDNVDTAEFDRRIMVQHFWCGLSEFNPRGLWGVDIKMWLYAAGAVQLQLNILSCVAAHILHRSATSAAVAAEASSAGAAASVLAANGPTAGAAVADSSAGGLQLPFGSGSMSLAMAAYAACLSFFVAEYMWHEVVHLWTYDIFRERIGFKLLFGCLAFYPFFYAVGILPLIDAAGATADISPAAAVGCVGLFFGGWALTRGANLQKFACKQGRRSFLWGLVPMETVPGSHGRLLCSGFWGSARHINYCGEILQAVALALPGWLATGSLLPWLYPAYYVGLFIPRQLDDDAICAAKYGPVWVEYCRRVPYRMVPGLW